MIKNFLENFKREKETYFGFFTSILIYSIMIPLIILEHKKEIPRVIDFEFLFFKIQKMPMVLYMLILTITLSTICNFFRDFLNLLKQVILSKIDIKNSFVKEEIKKEEIKEEIKEVKNESKQYY